MPMSTRSTAAESVVLISTYLLKPLYRHYDAASHDRSVSVDPSRQAPLLHHLTLEALSHYKHSFFSQCYRQHPSMKHESSMRAVIDSAPEHHAVPKHQFCIFFGFGRLCF